MIQTRPQQAATGPEDVLVLRPNRSLTGTQLAMVVGLLGASASITALFAWSQGNAFAPAFALFDVVLVAVAFRLVWRSGERVEEIAVGGQRIEVRRTPSSGPPFQAHPYWVRLRVAGGEGSTRVVLASQGREVEVGSFLGDGERRELARRLQDLLARASGRAGAAPGGT